VRAVGSVIALLVVFAACVEAPLAPSGEISSHATLDAGVDGHDAALEELAVPVPGLHAEYFDDYYDERVDRVEPNLDRDWKAGSPDPAIGVDHFSARWTGELTPAVTGKTTLAIDADDGTRVWIGDELVIDDWHGHLVERHTAEVDLTKDVPVTIRVDYFEVDLDASIRLSWSAAGLPEEVIPADRFTTKKAATGLRSPKPPFSNPVIASDCADPGVLGVGATFYSACTGGTLPVRSSRDLVRWNDVPNADILLGGKPSWAANGDRNWAPEIHAVGNRFVAYYTSVNGKNDLSIGATSSSSPTGPWVDRGSPLVEDALGVIDATYFEDEDGSRWLFYKVDGNHYGKPTPIFVRRLSADGLSFDDGSVATQVLVNEPATWEGGVVEAPWVVKRDGRYFMLYSGNVYDQRYRTGVARATSLTGPWEKHGAPLLENNAAWVGPGHGSVVQVNALDYFVYHAWKNDGAGGTAPGGRHVLVDRITWKDGWPAIAGGSPTATDQPWPGETF
jgi:GH43 family beta-xylosidase